MTLQIPTTTIFAPGPPLFLRSSTIRVGTVKIQNVGLARGIDAEFTVRRNLKPSDPNTCDLKIWNLSESTRKAIEQSAQKTKAISAAPGTVVRVVPVQIEAGFVGNTSTLFLGEMRSAETITDGADYVTELSTGDGDNALALQRINQNFPVGSSTVKIVQALVQQMGVGTGNLSSVAVLFNNAPLFQKGATLKGNAAERLTKVCASVGLEFSIQGGKAFFLPIGQPMPGAAIVLAPDTGLWGSPTVDTKGVLQCQCALIPALAPGAAVEVDSAFVQGLFRITSITTTGATSGNEWSHTIEAKSIGLSP